MKKLTQEELNGIIESHEKWLRDEEGGKKADLSYNDLSGLDLSNANLTRATLTDADLTNANLANANLAKVSLYCADLTGSILTGANLNVADLYGADLTDATLVDINLADADLTGAILTNATLPEFQIPQDQDLIVWKKLRKRYNDEQILCKLLIPADVARTANLVGNKCRAASAKVLEFQDTDGNALDLEKAAHWPYNGYRPLLVYIKGVEVVPDKYDPDIRKECTHGIHFFLTKEEALDW